MFRLWEEGHREENVIWSSVEVLVAEVEAQYCGVPWCSPDFLWLCSCQGVLGLEGGQHEGGHLEMDFWNESVV